MHHYGGDPNERDNFKNHPCFQACVDFCERRDRSSFDPYYPDQTAGVFRADGAWGLPAAVRKGVATGLPPV